MTLPTVSAVLGWRPDELRAAADDWDAAATDIHAAVALAVRDVASTSDFWSGSAADAARRQALDLGAASDALARRVVMAAIAARDGAEQIATAQAALRDCVDEADDSTVSPLLVALSGGSPQAAQAMLDAALERLCTADADAAADIEAAFAQPPSRPAATVPASAWPMMSQDQIADQIAAMSAEQREQLVTEFPRQVGNTDGVPWDMRVAANRLNIAQTIVDERGDDPDALRRRAFYRSLLAEVDDPGGTDRRIDRQILAFDADHASLVELNGSLSAATSVAVLVPGLNTTIEGSAANTETARRFVSATHGDVAVITYLGGPFPHGSNLATALVDAADPRYALDMAPRLVAFSEDVDRTVDATDRLVPVTYIGHSYGGSIVGTAEALGLTSDRTLFVAAAGAGVGVDDPGDWHNRNPDVLRFSMTAPGDFIQVVQGIPGGPHGSDPDHMPGVIRLTTGHYDDGRLMAGPQAHSDVLNSPSDAWRNILAVITGDRETLHKAG